MYLSIFFCHLTFSLSYYISVCLSVYSHVLQTLLLLLFSSQYQRVSNFCYFLMLFPMCLLQRLANTKAHTSRFISANLPCNKFKNRLVNIMPYESTRVCLQPIRGVEGSDYINGSFIDGYRWAEEPGSVCVSVCVWVWRWTRVLSRCTSGNRRPTSPRRVL